ncbi:MAG: hypothetical protein ACLR2G_01310 [Phascolarctobacterium faecium]
MVEIKKILHNKIYYYEQLDSIESAGACKQAAEGTNYYCRKADWTRTNVAEMKSGRDCSFRDPQTNDRCRILPK